MTVLELFGFALRGLAGHGLRTGLSLLGVSIGVASVLVLTALGEGAKRYVVGQFQSLGTNLLIVLPGKTETSGSFGIGGVPNDLTLDDAEAIERFVPQARRVAPISMGTEEVAYGALSRQIAVIGTTPDYLQARQLRMASGEFLPEDEFSRGAAVAVLGHKAARELFRGEDPIGKVVRIGGWRMRVIGVLGQAGRQAGDQLRRHRHRAGGHRHAHVQPLVAVPHPDPGARAHRPRRGPAAASSPCSPSATRRRTSPSSPRTRWPTPSPASSTP